MMNLFDLDLLYRTFRRDFEVLRAESGTAALNVLCDEGEVTVIISDQRMPEMNGTEFLSKTVADFPDTARIILTGFTDSSDPVEAINAGQVYRYITKPWDADELSHIVNQALETYEQSSLQWDTPYFTLDDVTHLLNLMAPLLASSIKTFSL